MSDPSKGRHPLSAIFEASSIAVVGASSDPAKRGNQIIRALQASGYEGSVFPVNPKGGSLLGLEVPPTLEAIGQPVELAVVCTPARTTPEVIAACGRAGVKGAVILAVGFGESGSEGAELEEALLVSAKEAGVRIVGPNTSGIGNLPLGMNLIGAQGIRPGGLALPGAGNR